MTTLSVQQSTPLDRVLSALGGGRKSGETWAARCPAHEDGTASLSVALGRDGQTVVLRCHAGCETPDVVRCAGLDMSDLFPPKERSQGRRIVATYAYTDRDGRTLFEVTRYSPKDFRQRRPDGRGGHLWGLNGTPVVLYRLPELVGGVAAERTVFIVEGEKDADAVARAGGIGTCGPMGAGKWSKVAADAKTILAGAAVIVVADKDEAGRRHASEVEASLRDVAASVRVVEAKTGKDAADHLGAGHGLDDFVPLDSVQSVNRRVAPAEFTPRPVLVRVSDVQPEQVKWLWAGYLPLAKLGLLDGDPGLGKSTVTLNLAAAITTGGLMPDGSPCPGPAGVVLLSAEDGIADTMRPRLEAAGADLANVAVLEGVTTEAGVDRSPALPVDIAQLEAAVVEMRAVLVVIDPLMAFLGADVNSFRDQDVRTALHPLKQLAERTGATVLLVRHLNKGSGASAIYRGGGSIGIIGAARAGLLVAKDPKDPDRRIVAVTKLNVGAPGPAMAFRLVHDDAHGCGVVQWDGTTEHRADDLLRYEDEDERTERDDAEEALRSLLSTGPRPSKDVEREMTRSGFSKATTRRAKKAARIEARKSGMAGGWFWHLPSEGDHLSPEGVEDAHPLEANAFDTFGSAFGAVASSECDQPPAPTDQEAPQVDPEGEE